MGLPDPQLVVQTILYLVAVGTGLVISVPTGITHVAFGGNCILYGKVTWYNSTYFTYTFGSSHACNYVIYTSVLACILYALGMAVYFCYAIYRSRVDETISTQMWVMPFILSNSLVCIVSFISACILSVGFGLWCQSFKSGTEKGAKINSCADGQSSRFDWNRNGTHYTSGSYYQFLTVAQSAAWIAFAVWVVQLALSVLRFIRNRRLRSSDSYPEDVTTSDKREIAKENPTA